MLAAAAAICGDAHVLDGAAAASEYGAGRWGEPLLVARPASVEAVQALVRHAASEAGARRRVGQRLAAGLGTTALYGPAAVRH